MMDYLNEVEIHGVQINDKTKITMVIESLPDTFKEFKVSYILNNKDMTLIELMHELHAIEEFYHSRKLPKKGFSSRLKLKDKNEQERIGIGKLSTKRSGKPKGKCYKCGQKDHWKKDYPKIIKIRILLSITVVLDYEIWQMDVKTAFLNGHLEEDIYMQQPDGFIQKGQEHMDQSPKTSEEIEKMRRVPYVEAVGSLMYIMLCTRPDVCFAVEMVGPYDKKEDSKHKEFVEAVIDLSRSITERKLHLVYGGGNRGLSKLVSEAAFVRGSQVLGIILRALKPLGSLSDSPTVEELVVSGDLATLEALITLASWAYLHIHPKPIAKKLFICAHTANELLDLLQAYRPEPDPWTFVLERPNNDGNSSRSKKYKLDLTLRL
ncbi:hypothetical protein WN944_024367 [Citrus x changshan-huyou]|uniref:Uncharacterized protein n=1 Tax=Citrus x changshan-huyou TaxID=2935761 RepID=A0AAP0LU42_9ROSI